MDPIGPLWALGNSRVPPPSVLQPSDFPRHIQPIYASLSATLSIATMLRGAGRAFASATPARVAGKRSYSRTVRNTRQSNLALALTSSSLVAGSALWYVLHSGDVIHNDASPSASDRTANAADVSAKVILEDEELSTLVWGSNKYVYCTHYQRVL